MGSSDSSCCGNRPIHKPETNVQALKQNRILHQVQQSRQESLYLRNGEELNGDYTAYYQLLDSFKLYHQQSINLNKRYQQQSEQLAMSFIDELKDKKADNTMPEINTKQGDSTKTPDYKNTQKRKYGRLQTQIQILQSEGSRAQSLLLFIQTIDIEKDGHFETFGFLSFLKNDVNVEELFNKFPQTESLSCSQFMSILTLTAIIYKITKFQLETGTNKEPKISGQKTKASVEHFAMWCIRKYGTKRNERKSVQVVDDLGNEIKEKYHLYSWNFTRYDYMHNLCHWVQEYVNCDGRLY